MRIGIIGPQTSTDKISKMLQNSSSFIEPIAFPYGNFTECIEIIKNMPLEIDALLFTGQTPYRYATNFLTPTIPWEYLPRNSVSLFSALIKASSYFTPGRNLLSMDNFDSSIMEQLQEECSFNDLELEFCNKSFDLLHPNYFQDILDYHVHNYQENHAVVCLTGTQQIYEQLCRLNIPCIKVSPSPAILRKQLDLLCTKYRLQAGMPEHQIAVICVKLNFADEYSINFTNELHQLKSINKTMEAIYYFSSRTGAAVFPVSTTKYFLALNYSTLMAETDQLRHLSLLRSVLGDSHILTSASIGIGIGGSHGEAKAHATKAELHARNKGSFCCYAMDKNHYLMGPIALDSIPAKDEQKQVDQNLLTVSKRSGVGMKNLSTICSALTKYNLDAFTPTELAHYCQLSPRSINRIIEKLDAAGYIQIVGKHCSNNGTGRPSRIIKLLF